MTGARHALQAKPGLPDSKGMASSLMTPKYDQHIRELQDSLATANNR